MKILVLGSGGREHSLVQHLAQSAVCEKVFALPGNLLWAQDKIVPLVHLDPLNFEMMADFIEMEKISITLVGPELLLDKGVVDYLEKRAIPQHLVFAPSKQAAQLECSKSFAKDIMQKAGIPTARSFLIEKIKASQVEAFLQNPPFEYPMVYKADGLAAGKGVVIVQNDLQARQIINDFWNKNKIGSAADKILVEEFLPGVESSFMLAVWGDSYKVLPSSKDYKTLFNNQEGPNTGGMGSIVPSPHLNVDLEKEVEKLIVQPLLSYLKSQKIIYKGFLYVGLMLGPKGPKVLEFNARLGDPETQSILFSLAENLLDTLENLSPQNAPLKLSGYFKRKEGVTLTTVLAAPGYPEKAIKDLPLPGLNEYQNELILLKGQAQVLFAGVKYEGKTYLSNGGRVLNIVTQGSDLKECKDLQKDLIEIVQKDAPTPLHYRTDIGM